MNKRVKSNSRLCCWVQQQLEYKAFMDDLRQDKQLWHCKTVKVSLPRPLEFGMPGLRLKVLDMKHIGGH